MTVSIHDAARLRYTRDGDAGNVRPCSRRATLRRLDTSRHPFGQSAQLAANRRLEFERPI